MSDRWKKVHAIRKKAEDGDADAMCALAGWYFDGEVGLVEDLSLSHMWTKKSAELGHAKGMADLGHMLYTRLGVEKNQAEGVLLIGMAAEEGSCAGAFYLALCYAHYIYAGDELMEGLIGKNPVEVWVQLFSFPYKRRRSQLESEQIAGLRKRTTVRWGQSPANPPKDAVGSAAAVLLHGNRQPSEIGAYSKRRSDATSRRGNPNPRRTDR